jgi:hypothetical protein
VEPAGTDRQTLHDDLLELRNVMISVDVNEADHDCDLRLRAARSDAIGAARSLASASHSRPRPTCALRSRLLTAC